MSGEKKFNNSISVFSSATSPKPDSEITLWDYLSGLVSGAYEIDVMGYRKYAERVNRIKAKWILSEARLKKLDEAVSKRKKRNACVTASGTFTARAKDKLIKHSGYIVIDLDSKENPGVDLLQKREDIYKDPYLAAGWVSIGGLGLSLLFKIPISDKDIHEKRFDSLRQYVQDTYRVTVDKSGRDVSRLRFNSYDPDLYYTENAIIWTALPKKQEVNEIVFHSSDENFNFVLGQIDKDITGGYSEWLTIAFAIASEFGEGGRDAFHKISSYGAGYIPSACDRQYSYCLKSSGSGITLGSFYHACKSAGYETQSPMTRLIATQARYGKKMQGKPGQAKDQKKSTIDILESKGIPEEISRPIVESVFASKVVEKISDDEKTNQINDYLDSLNIPRNLVNDKLYYKGIPETDSILSQIYIDAYRVFPGISKPYVMDYIHRVEVTSYHPFLEFYERNKHRKDTGLVEKLIDTIKGDGAVKEQRFSGDTFNQVFIQRWLLSVVASSLGTHSVLILVLYGNQSSGKTKFLRGLLPEELQPYFAESKLDRGKDDEILMCEKLIVMDDEWGGKSKRDAAKLKDMCSKSEFTLRDPYGKKSRTAKRYAVLCGTSNDMEVISDDTGNRRVIPVHVESIDLKAYDKIDKVGLWMELKNLYEKHGDEAWMLGRDEIAVLNGDTEKNNDVNIELELVQKYCSANENKAYWITLTELYTFIMDKHPGIRVSQPKLGKALRKEGYRQEVIKVDGKTKRLWNVVAIG